MTTTQAHTEEVDRVHELGWAWTPDSHHPKNMELGYYAMHLSDAAYGWYTHPEHRMKYTLLGDSVPRWQAARTVLSCWQ